MASARSVRRRKQKQHDRSIAPPLQCEPASYTINTTPPNCVARSFSNYLQQLQEHDCPARPRGWPQVLYEQRGQPPAKKRQGVLWWLHQHRWLQLPRDHYSMAHTADQFAQALRGGLCLPLLVAPDSALGGQICSSQWHRTPLEDLLDTILANKDATISVQNHASKSVETFTSLKTCREVRDRFALHLRERGCAWNCLEVDDALPGFKGPSLLQHGGELLRWQFASGDNSTADRSTWAPVSGAKRVDQWLLVSEAGSGSFAHVDVGYGTWLSTLKGKKTIWFRNLASKDESVWAGFGPESDHRAFVEPWARVDLHEGYTFIFPPGTVHVVYTPEDTVCCGGHFLVPQVMACFVDTLGKLELDPTRTNDFKGTDFFSILRNFMSDVMRPTSADLSATQLEVFISAINQYIGLQPRLTNMGKKRNQDPEQSHLQRRAAFVNEIKDRWLELLDKKWKELKG